MNHPLVTQTAQAKPVDRSAAPETQLADMVEAPLDLVLDAHVTKRWTRPILEFIAQLYLAGDSFSDISQKLYVKFGLAFTKNAILGKVYRSNWGQRHPGTPKKKKTRVHGGGHYDVTRSSKPMAKPKPQNSDQPEPALDGFLPPMVIAEAGQCHWIEGKPARGDQDWRYCGAPTGLAGERNITRSYCQHHHDRMTDKAGTIASNTRPKKRGVGA